MSPISLFPTFHFALMKDVKSIVVLYQYDCATDVLMSLPSFVGCVYLELGFRLQMANFILMEKSSRRIWV